MNGSLLSWFLSDGRPPYWLEQAVLILFYGGILLYLLGPRAETWLKRIAPRLGARLLLALPGRLPKMERDFSAMLAVLLDAGVPEPRAVALAGESADNFIFQSRARSVIDDLGPGAALTDAIGKFDLPAQPARPARR